MNHPVVKAGLDVATGSAIVTYWAGLLPGIVAFAATLASLIYYSISIYNLTKNKK